MVVRGSRDFIKEITNSLTGMKIQSKEESENQNDVKLAA